MRGKATQHKKAPHNVRVKGTYIKKHRVILEATGLSPKSTPKHEMQGVLYQKAPQNVCNEVTIAPREDTALRSEFGGTRPGMPRDHAPSPVFPAASSWDLGQCVTTSRLHLSFSAYSLCFGVSGADL